MNRFGIFLVIAVALTASGVYMFVLRPKNNNTVPSTTNSSSTVEKPAKTTPAPPFVDLQPLVDSWGAKQNGSASVVVYDLANKKLNASLNPDKQYFTASLYKLFVAYYGYQKVADNTYRMDDPYLPDYSRAKCLDEMIRSSYSPCGEAMRDELGKETLTEKLKTYGLKNTSLSGLQTSAGDTAIILERLFEKTDLTEDHTKLFLDSMLDQPAKFRIGLPSGFANAKVYNKVGWNENLEWHDASIVTLPNGRSYVVVVLTRSVGRANVVDLARKLSAELTK